MAAAPAPAQAQAPGIDGQVVLIAATTDGEQMQRLEAAVRDAALGAHLQVVAVRGARIDPADVLTAGAAGNVVASPTTPLARLWIDAGHGSPAVLYLTDGARRRVYARQVPLERGLLDRVALEGIALIVRSSLDALIAGREIGVTREDFARSVVEPPLSPRARVGSQPRAPLPSTAPPRHPRDVALFAGYELVRAAPPPYQHRIVVDCQSSWPRVRVGASVAAMAPETIGAAGVGARLLTAGASLSVGAHWDAGRWFHLTAGVGLGVEAVRVAPNVGTAELRATPPFWAGALSWRGFARFERPLTPIGDRWIVGLLVGAEVRPSPERYLISDGQGSQVVFQSPRWRPLVGLLVGRRI